MADDWSDLPSELLELISARIKSPVDYISFRCVCTSWRSAAAERPLLPLLASYTVDANSSTSTFNSFSFTGEEIVPIEHNLLSDLAPNKLCCGSSHGWLILIDQFFRLTLFNPFTKSRIDLPPTTLIPFLSPSPSPSQRRDYFPSHPQPVTYLPLLRCFCMDTKIVLSADPSLDPDFLVILMGGLYLLFWTREASWRWIELPMRIFTKDLLFYKGQLVFMDDGGEISAYTIGHEWLFDGTRICNLGNHFLVESADDLLLVQVLVDYGELDTVYSSNVFKLVLGKRRLVKVENLGDRALFLGHNLGISVCASEYPGCRANCIYWAFKDEQALVMVCLEDGSNKYISGPLSQFQYCSTLWLKPSLLQGPSSHGVKKG